MGSMGRPSEPNALENKVEPIEAVGREPSYPDRARIDSDVRAFLRPASSPWIVFDRDSRIDDFARSALRVGAVFASSPSFRDEGVSVASVEPPVDILGPMVVAMTDKPFDASTGMFPKDVEPSDAATEPSTIVATTEVNSDSAVAVDGAIVARERIESDPFAVPGLVPNRTRSRAFVIAGACAGFLALVGITSVAVARPSHALATKTRAAVTTPIETRFEPAPVVRATPAAMRALAAHPPAVEPAASAAEPAESEPAGKMSNDPKRRFGRLTIKADSKTKTVWFDGKRMLGNGTRSFMVFCGMHTVAVNDKSDAKDVEVPCNGEFVAQAK